MRVLVSGGAGFLGSHLCARLLGRGDAVVCLDDFSTGSRENVAGMEAAGDFSLVVADVSSPSLDLARFGRLDAVCHLASPASPPAYRRLSLATLRAGSRGTENCLELAVRHDARFLLASTSEVYGEPAVHPQPEEYWGNVNPVGPRSMYDEAKRFAEAMTTAYRRSLAARSGIVRIFNTYGPHMRPDDGRVVSSFVTRALAGEPLLVHGDGAQTRSLCYVDDLVEGLLAMIDGDEPGPVNLGNPEEVTMLELATLVIRLARSASAIAFAPRPDDDPTRRRPDVSRAAELLGWTPTVPLPDGLARTIEWFSSLLARGTTTP